MGYTPSFSPADSENHHSFGAVGGDITNSEVVSQYDIYNPHEMNKLLFRHGLRPRFINTLESMDGAKPCSTPLVGQFELGWWDSTFIAGAIVTPAGAPGADIVVELDPSLMVSPAGVTISAVQQEATYVQERDEILLASGDIAVVRSVNTTVSPFQVTLYPKLAAVDLDATLLEGVEYAIPQNNYQEGEGAPKGRTPRFITYSNTFQIVKETYSVTATESTHKMRFSVRNVEGSIVVVLAGETMDNWNRKRSNTLLFGQQYDNTASPNTTLNFDTPDTGTQGYFNFVETYGHSFTYAPAAWNITDFDVIAKTFEREMIPFRNFMYCMGIDLHQEVTNELYNNNIQSNADYVYSTFGGAVQLPNDPYQFASPADFAINIGFKSFIKDTFAWHFKSLHEMNGKHEGGAGAYEYSQRAYISPMGMKAMDDKVERATMGYEYAAYGDVVRQNVTNVYQGAGFKNGQVSTDREYKSVIMSAEIAGCWTCANQSAWVTPV